MSDDYNLRPLWNACLAIYKEVAKVCDAHGLRYYVNGGTALGAMRHQGFIPWDDDFDIMMPRQDYRKLLDIYSKELPSYLATEDFHNDEHRYGFKEMFGKVYETRPEVIAKVAEESNLDLLQGVFIDIFPIDGYPGGWLSTRWWYFVRTIKRCVAGFGNRPWYTKPFVPFLKFIFGFGASRSENAKKFEKWLMKWDFDSAPAVDDYNIYKRRTFKHSYTKANIEPATMVPFEDIMVPMPHDTEYYVEEYFGNWRQMPPEEHRHPTHQVKCTSHED